jgi:regulator of replication initiation timing
MSRREEMNDKVENAGIPQALAELIEKNHALAIELEALAGLVQNETAAAREREAEQAARLDEVLGELAAAEAAVEMERQGRIEAENRAAGLAAAFDAIQAALAGVATAPRGTSGRGAEGNDRMAAVQSEAPPAALPPTDAADCGATPDGLAAEDDEHRSALADAEKGTMSIVVNLTPAETVALETFAARDGNGGGINAAAAGFIRDGLRRSGWKPAADENRSRRE